VPIARLAGGIAGEAHDDAATRLAYATDASVYRVEPRGVVVARHVDDIAATLDFCRAEGVPLTARGAGTSLAGQAIGAGIVLDTSRVDRILEVDPERRLARVEPGVVQADLDRAAGEHGLCFGPDTATATRATLAGMIGNDSAGMRSVIYGRTSHRVRRLRVLLADGSEHWVGESEAGDLDGPFAAAHAIASRQRAEIQARWPKILRCVDGYNLPALMSARPHLARFLCGSEGTLALVLEAEVELDMRPELRAWTVVRLATPESAGDATLAVLPTGPTAVEIIDAGAAVGSAVVRELAAGADTVLLIEHSGTPDEVAAGRAALPAIPGATSVVMVDGLVQSEAVLELRRSMLGATQRHVSGPRLPTTVCEDGAVPVERLSDFLADLRRLVRDEGTASVFYGHGSVGCVHARPLLDLTDPEDRARFRRLAEGAAEMVLSRGGALSGEHGDGMLRAELLPRMFGDELIGAFRDVKRAFDPEGILNPGRIIDAPRLDDQLRALRLPVPRHPLELAVSRCVGIAACVDRRAGVMCPPYRVTMHELHTTRGRANLLREAMSGGLGADDPGLEEALALCVGCKACKGECPAGVDMAWIKAEVTAERHLHGRATRAERAFAHLPERLARAARMPRTANAVAGSPIGRYALRRLGFDPQRKLPRLARTGFRELAEGRYGVRRVDVALFVDTFTQWIEPDVGMAALDVFDAIGATPAIAPNVCCGRTFISGGFLDEARYLAAENVRRLLPLAAAGVPLVGLEPSCVLTLRDELLRLLPGDEDARLVARHVFLFEEVLDRWDALDLAPLDRTVLVHPHCHARALADPHATARALSRAPGADVRTLDAGCCGMAGAFGYRLANRALSFAMANDRLVPAIREHPGAVLVAHGTSCRAQIRDVAGVEARHPAQLLRDLTPARQPG
jgi:FAD/FMN-containing dehydrogenase/Fe-S oxidoreductase